MQPKFTSQRTTLPWGLEFLAPQEAPHLTGEMAQDAEQPTLGKKLHPGGPSNPIDRPSWSLAKLVPLCWLMSMQAYVCLDGKQRQSCPNSP